MYECTQVKTIFYINVYEVPWQQDVDTMPPYESKDVWHICMAMHVIKVTKHVAMYIVINITLLESSYMQPSHH